MFDENTNNDINNSSQVPETDTPQNTQSSAPEGDSYSYDATSHDGSSYSMKGSQLHDNKTYIHTPGEYEVSYDSQKGQYTHTQYTPFTNNNPNPAFPHNEEPIKPSKKSSVGGLAAILICICIVLSCIFGAGAGFITYSLLSDSGIFERGDVYTEDATVKVNYAETESTAIVSAADIAKETVVVIDTFASENALRNGNKLGSGSGVIWSDNGYIVTCNHVIDNAAIVVVTLFSGDRLEAAVVGKDPQTDLAVIKISTDEKLNATSIRGTDIILGETVIAIGNPLGTLSNTVTDGIISCLERQISVEGQTMTLMQTNAAVNPGNSGGGLYDTNGSLVGIVNAKSSDNSVEGIGFAIPITTVEKIAKDLIEKGYVSGRPSFGFESVYITSSNYQNYPELYDYAVSGNWIKRVTSGMYVTNTESVAGYADSSELMFGDRVIQVGNKQISTESDLISALSKYSVGETVEITIVRNHNTTVIIKLVLTESGKQ